MECPLEMLGPTDFLEAGLGCRDELVPNIHYLHDRGLAELMVGYNPKSFAAARITADGIDLVENRFEFNLRFPPETGELQEALAEVPCLIERLVEEADLSPLDGEARKCLLRDVQYLRDEVARPEERWRHGVIESILNWMAEAVDGADDAMPSLPAIREAITRHVARLG